jgi:hypothetical protein
LFSDTVTTDLAVKLKIPVNKYKILKFIILKNSNLKNELVLINLAGNESNWQSSTETGQERIFINSSLFDISQMFRTN